MSQEWNIFICIESLITQIFYLQICLRDPGYLKPQLEFRRILELYDDLADLCPDCQLIRTPRSRHCSVCKRCVDRFDHHCPWIDNCVGIRNHNYFIMYLYSQFALVLTVIISSVSCMIYILFDRWYSPSSLIPKYDSEDIQQAAQSYLFDKETMWFYFFSL